MKLYLRNLFLFLAIILPIPALGAPQPFLAFSDLISGPSVGLNDGKGSGAIVTIWGQNLGTERGRVFFTSSDGVKREASYVYYWKPADGSLPGGPADLFTSHRMYEVAFSIPKSPDGPAEITIETANQLTSNQLTFNVRSGNIYHVMPNGDNASGDGSINSPWAYVNGYPSSQPAPGNQGLKAGDIVYSHGVKEPSFSGGGRDAGMYLRGLQGTLARQIAIAAYPGTQPTVDSPRWGIHPYLTTGIVVSKYIVKGGLLDDPKDNSDTFGAGATIDSTMQIKTSENGRIIANRITDSAGKCSNGWHGAISSGEMGGSNVKIYGNFIHDLGCRQTSHFHHTTYMSKRETSDSTPSIAWEFGWNRLEGNEAKFGIHSYDQSPFDSRNCGDVVGTLRIHDNFIRNQRGSGINVKTNDYDQKDFCWTADISIYKNVLINTGLGPVSEINNGTAPYGISVGGDLGGNVEVNSNLILNVSDPSSREYAKAYAIDFSLRNTQSQITIASNIISVNDNIALLHKETSNHSIIENIWYSASRTNESVQNEITSIGNTSGNLFYDPEVAVFGNTITIGSPSTFEGTSYQGSLAITSTTTASTTNVDFYGNMTGVDYIGPFDENFSPPNPPSGINAQ
jgi:hypothetical protein